MSHRTFTTGRGGKKRVEAVSLAAAIPYAWGAPRPIRCNDLQVPPGSPSVRKFENRLLGRPILFSKCAGAMSVRQIGHPRCFLAVLPVCYRGENPEKLEARRQR